MIDPSAEMIGPELVLFASAPNESTLMRVV